MLLTEIQQQQQHLQRIFLLLTQLEQMGDSLVYDPNICQQHKKILIIWYENQIEKIREELDEIMAGLFFFLFVFSFLFLGSNGDVFTPNRSK